MKQFKSLKTLEKEVIKKTLIQTKYNVNKTYRILGCARSTVYRKVKEYNINLRKR